jgi:hypothetical protein
MAKDWTGDGWSTFVMNTRKKESEVQENDFYATSPEAIEAFLAVLKRDKLELPKDAWENASGQGHIVKVLKAHGYDVFASDIVDRGCCDEKIDFLSDLSKAGKYSLILTNPPFKFAKEFCEKSLRDVKDDGWVCMFLPLTILEGKDRFKFYRDNPPKYVYVYSSRQGCGKGGGVFKNSGARAYAFIVWHKGEKTEPILRWIPPNN